MDDATSSRAIRELVAYAGAIGFGLLAIILCTIASFPIAVWGPSMKFGPQLYAACASFSYVAAFVAGLRFLRRRSNLSPLSLHSRSGLSFFALVFATLILGAPQIHTQLAAAEVNEYMSLARDGRRGVRDGHPEITFLASIPIAPFVVLSYHEYQLARLNGAGIWEVQIWYVLGSTRVLAVPIWMS